MDGYRSERGLEYCYVLGTDVGWTDIGVEGEKKTAM